MELKDILAIKKATDSLDCTETHKLITLRENYAIAPPVWTRWKVIWHAAIGSVTILRE